MPKFAIWPIYDSKSLKQRSCRRPRYGEVIRLCAKWGRGKTKRLLLLKNFEIWDEVTDSQTVPGGFRGVGRTDALLSGPQTGARINTTKSIRKYKLNTKSAPVFNAVILHAIIKSHKIFDLLFPFLLLPLLLLDSINSLMEVEHYRRTNGTVNKNTRVTQNFEEKNSYSPMWARSEIFNLSSHPCNPAQETTIHVVQCFYCRMHLFSLLLHYYWCVRTHTQTNKHLLHEKHKTTKLVRC